MLSARTVKRVFSPLDEELALLPGTLTPSLQEDVVRLGSWMPFAHVVGEIAHFRRTDIGKATAVRLTEAAGAAYVELQTQAVEGLERTLPPPPLGPAQQFLSVDGAMVPLVGGEWAEVRTLVIGEVLPPQVVKGETVVQTSQHSYFARLLPADAFAHAALVETHRCGVESAQTVVAVTDGAEWIQAFLDYHCPAAVRILDFPHAAAYVTRFAQAQWPTNSAAQAQWLQEQLHQLKTQGPDALLPSLRQLAAQQADQAELTGALAYLEKRSTQMRYPTFQQAGWPIGDGAVESANKLVVEARLKGSGMHWARTHVDPMLALRTIVCSNRWAEAWPQIVAHLRHQAHARTIRRRQRRLAARSPTPPPAATPVAPLPPPQTALPPAPLPEPHPQHPRRPAPNHPWRRMPIGRARYQTPPASAKS